MNLPSYHKKIEVVLADRDFQGFVEEEGEAYIEGQYLVKTLRFNNRMTNEKGEYETKKYPVLEYFSESKLLKVYYRDRIPAIYSMCDGKLHYYGTEKLRLTKEGFDSNNEADAENGFSFLVAHLMYLYKTDRNSAIQMLSAVYQLENKDYLSIENLHFYKDYKTYYIHQDNNPFLINVTIDKKWLSFNYPYISYYFAGLKKYMREELKGSGWEII